MWDNGDCFGNGPVSQHSTYYFSNVPWISSIFFGRFSGHPDMDLHDRVYIMNKSVCIDDSKGRATSIFINDPNPDKYSAQWCGKCLPEAGATTVGGGVTSCAPPVTAQP